MKILREVYQEFKIENIKFSKFSNGLKKFTRDKHVNFHIKNEYKISEFDNKICLYNLHK